MSSALWRLVALGVWSATAAAAGSDSGVRRFALIVANDQGDADEERLKYAESDARRFLNVLIEVGGVAPRDGLILLGVEADTLEVSLRQFEQHLAKEAKPGDQLFVYVSSHADEGELHLGGSRVQVRRLTELLQRAPVRVAFLVLDACQSGAATRLKGLRPVPGAVLNLEGSEVTGRVVISSSRSEEFTQESDTYGGPFFTHHLIAGLRGAADAQSDGQVTLNEAYAYAYAQTVESTFASRAGVQHPSYHVDLKGYGDLVLTELSRAQARLMLDVRPPGEWMVRNADGSTLIGRLHKEEGPVTLAVTPGSYRLTTRRGATLLQASVDVRPFSLTELHGGIQVREERLTALKGGRAPGLTASLGGSVGAAAVLGMQPLVGASLRVALGRELFGPINLACASLDFRSGRATGEVRFGQDEWDVRVGMGRLFPLGRLVPYARLELGALWSRQWALPGEEPRASVSPQAVIVLGARLNLAWRLSLFAEGAAGAVPVRTLAQLELHLRASAAAGLGVDL